MASVMITMIIFANVVQNLTDVELKKAIVILMMNVMGAEVKDLKLLLLALLFYSSDLITTQN